MSCHVSVQDTEARFVCAAAAHGLQFPFAFISPFVSCPAAGQAAIKVQAPGTMRRKAVVANLRIEQG